MDKDLTNNLTIYTIGHSNVLASKIVDLLEQHEIKVLVDVRSSPYSQYSPQFNRENFKNTLKENQIEYKYEGEYLGGRPKDPSCYKNKNTPDGKADFLHLVDYPVVMTKDWFQKGIGGLIEISAQKRTAIMCSEEDPGHCHRHHLIGKFLLQKGIQVLHIRSDGMVVRAQQIPDIQDDSSVEQMGMF
jgi:uncharacterized protein (DUF488 family)